jgi:hypothetical protein
MVPITTLVLVLADAVWSEPAVVAELTKVWKLMLLKAMKPPLAAQNSLTTIAVHGMEP